MSPLLNNVFNFSKDFFQSQQKIEKKSYGKTFYSNYTDFAKNLSNYRVVNIALSSAFVITTFAPAIIFYIGAIVYDFSTGVIFNWNDKVVKTSKSNFSNVIKFIENHKVAILGFSVISLFAIRYLYYKGLPFGTSSSQIVSSIGSENPQQIEYRAKFYQFFNDLKCTVTRHRDIMEGAFNDLKLINTKAFSGLKFIGDKYMDIMKGVSYKLGRDPEKSRLGPVKFLGGLFVVVLYLHKK